MTIFVDAYVSIRDFFEAGGNVLWGILGVTTLMWTFIIERLWFFVGVLPQRVQAVVEVWESRDDTTSWFAKRVRDQLVSGVSLETHRFILMIKSPAKAVPINSYLPKVFSAVTPLGVDTLRTWLPTTSGSPIGRVIIRCSVSPGFRDELTGSWTQVLSPPTSLYFIASNLVPGVITDSSDLSMALMGLTPTFLTHASM